jgi:hypothetical protein
MRIIGKGQENDPAQGKRMPDKTASRVLRSNAKGKDVDPAKVHTAKKAARDHYAHEADKVKRGRRA